MKRWGILGTGRITRKLAAAIHAAAGAELVAIASRDQGRAEAAAREMSIPAAYGSYEALLAAPDIDAVYNALPNSLHGEWTIKAAAAGKHILCEKPLASGYDEATAMFSAAREHKVFLMEAFMYRFHPQTLHVQRLLAEGAIGRVNLVRSDFGFLLDRPADVRWSAELSGGALMDVGCYPLSFTRMALGGAPKRVSAAARWSAGGIDVLLAATLEYADGTIAQLACDFVTAFHQTVQIHGDAGLIALDRPFTMLPDKPSTIQLTRGAHFAPVETITIPAVNHYQLQIEGFGRLLDHGHGDWPEMPLVDTLDNLRTIEALYRSAREGRPIDIA
jgi:xylose dehydrogenase (NAD/NADP)